MSELISFKIVILGITGVGKSSIMASFIHPIIKFNEEIEKTISVEMASKVLIMDGKKVKLCIWDTAGQLKFRSIVSLYIKGSQAGVFVYDLNDPESLEYLNGLIEEFDLNSEPGAQKMILANKSDLISNEIEDYLLENGRSMAIQTNSIFLVTSAKNNFNIENSFKLLAEELLKSIDSVSISNSILLKSSHKAKPKENSKCC